MTAISVSQPLDEAEWEAQYHKFLRTPDQLKAVGAKLAELIEEYRTAMATITAADCEEFVRDVAIRRTFEGWSTRRDQVLERLRDETQIPFEYLRDHPQDWRPKTFAIDFAAEHPLSSHWLGVKVVPESIGKIESMQALGAKYESMRALHEEFEAKGLGKVLVLPFSGRGKSVNLDPDALAEIQDAWAALGEE